MLKNVLPISDGKVFHNTGGSHWIVLVFDRSNSTFSYIDLLKNNNLSDTKRVMSKLSGWLDIQNTRLIIIDCPRQINGYACGIYTTYSIENILLDILASTSELQL